MSSTALFRIPTKQSKTRHVYQFKAGRMSMKPTKMVHADPRKGWVYLYVSGDSKLHFCWIERSCGMVEVNMILDPKTASFKKVSQCQDGRVYLLKNNDDKFFIWMQEPNSNNDEKICNQINNYIKSPPKSDSSDILGGLHNLSQNDLLTILSMGVNLGGGLDSVSELAGPATPTVSAHKGSASKAQTGSKIQLEDLRNIMSNLPTSSSPASTVDMSDVLNAERVKTLLAKPGIKEKLVSHLPSLSDSEDLSSVKSSFSDPLTHIRSSQFHATMQAFNSALANGALGSLLEPFNLGKSVTDAASKGDLVAMAKALEDELKQSKSSNDKMETD